MRSQRVNQRGFTLLELIGVMAVLAILSAALAPSIFQAIDDAYAVAESDNLKQLGEDLRRYVRTTGQVPSRSINNWAPALASVSETPEERVRNNRRGQRRLLYFDPQFIGPPDSNFNGYTQTTGLAAAPLSPRLMIISDMERNVPNQPANSASFDAIWNQSAGATIVESDTVKIERINMMALFHRVLLVNANTSQTGYQLGFAAAFPVTASNGTTDGIVSRYVIDGTELRVFNAPYPAGALATATLVNDDVAMRYDTDGTLWFWSAL
ncbi:MAG: type II secretion system protein [Pseudomonadota bacterium]